MMGYEKRKISFFRIGWVFFLGALLFGEESFACQSSEEAGEENPSSRLVRKSHVKKRKPLREEMQEIVKSGASEYALVSSSKLPHEQPLELEEENQLLNKGFENPEAFRRLFNFYWSPLATHFCYLQLSSVMEGMNPSLNIMFRKDEETPENPLIKMFFINSYSEAACLAIGNLNSTIKSAATFFKTSLEGSIEQIFWKIFFRTLEEVSEGESKDSLQFYTSLESEDGVRKIVMRRPEKKGALYLEYLPNALK
ncbi:MAG TPA: hypothetical protein PLY23_03375 [Alphaproteobacteria bacterium]|nr:hypothetical protein [Alphaproteobacteria bacterium]HQS93777.1 hypothetical protein [Alphaproteobacteria bacterium]